jgi:NADP-reducing hydrogenase subunit HndB
MTTIKSLEDLKRVREQALEKRKAALTEASAQVIVGMGTCGIAAGANDAMKAILEQIEKDNMSGILVTQTGCIGLCEKEPIVQVIVGNNPMVTYGKVTPEVAKKIVQQHVAEGKILPEYVIEA